jgi:hypothetical protein
MSIQATTTHRAHLSNDLNHDEHAVLGRTSAPTPPSTGLSPDACSSGEPTTGKQPQGSRLIQPTGPDTVRFTEVVKGRLFGPLRPLEPPVAWLLQRQTTADLRRLKRMLEAPVINGSATEEKAN